MKGVWTEAGWKKREDRTTNEKQRRDLKARIEKRWSEEKR